MDLEELKIEVGQRAAQEVRDGMVLGLGTGSTAEAFLRSLATRVEDGLTVRGVPTSERTANLCRELGIPLTDLGRDPVLDLAIDGADEIDPDLNLIKGAGGALLREKIVASAARRMLVIADATKYVDHLGAFPLPVEINPFGSAATALQVERLCSRMDWSVDAVIRRVPAEPGQPEEPYVTDGGHWIVDCKLGMISDPKTLDAELRAIPGVVETGLFLGMADRALLATGEGVEVLERQNG
ncbi:MAG: ribose-5-phosphate isomerase RpiA [Devosiaceae bacterium]|nr:ribose-5-phosphate isomerase RpiA [Devosiaceae bacterium MH13]